MDPERRNLTMAYSALAGTVGMRGLTIDAVENLYGTNVKQAPTGLFHHRHLQRLHSLRSRPAGLNEAFRGVGLAPQVGLPCRLSPSLSPMPGPLAGGTPVTINFANFPIRSPKLGRLANRCDFCHRPTHSHFPPSHAAGTVDITVTNATGTSTTSSADQFTYTSALSSQPEPQSGRPPVGNSGDHHGTALLNTSTVSFRWYVDPLTPLSLHATPVTSPAHGWRV